MVGLFETVGAEVMGARDGLVETVGADVGASIQQ